MPAVTLILAGGLLLAGGLTSLRPAGPAAPAAVAGIGALLVVFTVAGGMSTRLARAGDLVDSLDLTEEVAAETGQRLDVQLAGARQLDAAVLPDLQTGLGLDGAGFAAYLEGTAPALAALGGNLEAGVPARPSPPAASPTATG